MLSSKCPVIFQISQGLGPCFQIVLLKTGRSRELPGAGGPKVQSSQRHYHYYHMFITTAITTAINTIVTIIINIIINNTGGPPLQIAPVRNDLRGVEGAAD